MNKIMTHIVAGYPNMEMSEQLVLAMDKAGVEFIEIQIPFSDPVADGPTLMHAQEVSLQNKTTTEDCFQFIKKIREKISTPLLIMTYFNVVHAYGVEKFCKKSAELGIYGLIVPDMPIEEEPHENYLAACKQNHLHAIQIVSPMTSVEKLAKISAVASGFVYCVSREGTTGKGDTHTQNLTSYFQKIRENISLPLALGFGIRNADDVREALDHADIAIIGSAVVDLIDQNITTNPLEVIEKFLHEVIS